MYAWALTWRICNKDKDGRLNTAERKTALAELEAGRPAAKFEKLRPITAPEFVRLDSTGWPQRGEPTGRKKKKKYRLNPNTINQDLKPKPKPRTSAARQPLAHGALRNQKTKNLNQKPKPRRSPT